MNVTRSHGRSRIDIRERGFLADTSYSIDGILVTTSGVLTFSLDGFSFLTATEAAALRLHVCDGDYDFNTANHNHTNTIDWSTTLDWSPPVVTRTVYLSLPANNVATGEPAISGTARADQVLTADASPIMDTDGLTDVDFIYQWIRVDADGTSNPVDITDANAATYTLTDADAGKKVKVKVSFTDELSGVEERTSAAYPSSGTVAVAGPNTAPTAANNTVTTGEDMPYAFMAGDFGFADTDTGDTLASVKIVAPPALGTLALDGTAVSADGVVTKAQIDGNMLTFRPAQDAHGDPYTTFTFKVNDGTVDSADAYTMTIDVTDAPAPVCAAPSFGDRREIWSGTVTVERFESAGLVFYGFDEVLSAGTLLPSQSFFIGSNNYVIDSIVVDSSGDLTFSLDGFSEMTSKEGDALRLHVCDGDYDFITSFESDNTTTWLATTLDWSPPVVTRTVYLSLPANNVATGEPAISGTAQAGQALTADASPIMDTDGLTGVDFNYQWVRVDADGLSNPADITDATAATYSLTAADAGKKIKVKVSFTDELSGEEERTSAAYPSSGTVIASANTTAPALTSVTVTSTPRKTTDTYGAREHIEFTMTFDAPVTVTGAPTFGFDLGGPSTATWYAGSGTTTLRFSHAVRGGSSGDRDTNGISWAANAIELNGGTIAGTDNAVTAVLTHDAQSNLAEHKVDGRTTPVTPATVTDVDVTSMPTSLVDTYGFGETIVITVTVSEAVEVEGDPVFRFNIGNPGSTGNVVEATYDRTRSTATTMVFVYTVQAGDMDTNGFWIGPHGQTFLLDANDRIRTASQQIDIDRSHSAENTQSGHKVDGSLGAPTVPPDPTAPTLVSATATTLTVEWTHPGDGNSPLVRNYVHYRVDGTTDWSSWYVGETPVTRTVIRNLEAATAYDVRVSVTNGIGSSQWVESATAFSTLGGGTASCPAPTFTGRRKIWTGVLTMGNFAELFPAISYRGYESSPSSGDGGGLDPATFTIGSRDYDIGRIALVISGGSGLNFYAGRGRGEWWDSTVLALRLHVCNTNFDLSDSGYLYTDEDRIVIESNHLWATDLDWSGVTTRTVYLSLPPNRPATGAPVITGPATVGQELAVDVTGIEDEDGLHDIEYTYQWLRVDADGTSNEEDITDATADTYTLTDDERGKKVKIEVSFPDDFGSDEQRTSAPATPAVSAVSGSTTSLSVSWAAPANAGKPAIASYDVQYRAGTSGTWSDGPEDVATSPATVTGLVANTLYEARVRATNADGDSGWSDPPGSGRTNTPTNNAPVFSPATLDRSVAENTGAGQNVGAAVTATDADAGDTLSYTLGGADVASFDFVEATGQIRTKVGVSYDHEAKSSYAVTVTASDGTATAVANVTISITDVDEPPNAPATPTVSAVSGSATSLSVSWAAPANAGKPAIDNYDVQYRLGSSGAWSDGPQDVTGTTATITSLATDTAYQARVRATNAEGDSGWSAPPGSGRTNAPSTSAPGAPGNLRTAPGDGQMTLTWTAPGNDGGAAIEKYRYRVSADGGSSWGPDWTDVPDGADAGDSAADETTFTVSGLNNGTAYVFQLRAVNSVGEGPAVSAADTPARAPLPPGSGFLVGNFGQPPDDDDAQIFNTQDILGVFTAGAQGATLDSIEFRLSTVLTNATVELPSATLYGASVTGARVTRGDQVAVLTAEPGAPGATAEWQTIAFDAPSGTRLAAGATYLVVLSNYIYVSVEMTTYPAEDAGGARGWAIDGIGVGNSSPYSYHSTASLLMRVNGTLGGATVATAPEAPASLGAAAGDARVDLIWTPPRRDGGAGIEKYQVRYSAGSRVDPETGWTDVPDGSDSGTSRADERSVSVTELDNGRQYAFELRAVNGVRAGAAATVTATPAAPPRSGFLVSNFGRPVDGAAKIYVTHDIVGVFTTGARGAELHDIEFRLFEVLPNITVLPIPSVTLYRASVTDSRATRGARVAALTAVAGSRQPPTNTAQTVAFAAPSGTRLDAGATYLVVLEHSTYAGVGFTTFPAEDAGGAPGWTIDGVGAGNSSPYSYGTSSSLLMSVNGTTAARAQQAVREEEQEEEEEEEDPDRGISLSASSSSAIEGQAVTIGVRRAGPTDGKTSVAVQVLDSALTGAWPIDLDLRSGVAAATATVVIPFDGARPASRTVTVRLTSVEEPYSVGSPSSLTFNVTERDAGLSVDDASVSEGPGATLAFAVTLDRTRDLEVRVKYATSDGTAREGEDYTGVSGTLRFAPGETTKTVSVAVLDDAHDEGSETLTLRLSTARRAVIDDATAVGTIVNSDPMPAAWLARFGRTAAVHVVERVEERIAAPREVGFEAQFAGRQVRPGMAREMAAEFLSQIASSAGAIRVGAGVHRPMSVSMAADRGAFGTPGLADGASMAADPMGRMPGTDDGLNPLGHFGMGFGGGNMLTGSAFVMNRETPRGGILSVWSRGAQSQFAGREGKLSLDGRVSTTMASADYAAGPLVAGLSLSHSRSRGGYEGVDIGEVTSSVTGLYPWLGYKATDRISLWGVTGYGKGALTLTPGAGAALQSGLSMAMAAGGVRGELADSLVGGFGLAFKADALWVGTGIEGVDGPEGRLAAAAAAVTRFRTGLEASRGYSFQRGLSLQPSLEVGLRRDGGAAETGAGVDIGGGLVVSDRVTGLSADVRVRMLLAHQNEGFSERGLSISFSFDPTPSTPLGFLAKVTPSWGGQATSGAQALWGQETMAGMPQGGVASGNRLEAELGYGMPVWGRLVGTPRFGIGASEYGRDYRLGYGLTVAEGGAMSFELGVDAHRRESLGQQGAEHGVQGRLAARW